MKIFLLTFFLLYGSAHLYVFLKARSALALRGPWAAVLVLFMALMVASPVLVRLAERGGHEPAARLLAWIGYTWMGPLFIFISSALAVDLLRLSGFALQLLLRRGSAFLQLPARETFWALLALTLVLSVYGGFEAWAVRTEEVILKTDKMPPGAPPVTIVQVSDIHLGLIVGEKRLERILEAVRRAEPDLLVSTGDLVDGQVNELDGLSGLFRTVKPKYGKFAVTGNHEFYAGIEHSLDFTARSGFTVLRGEGVTVGGLLNVVGVDDRTGAAFGGAAAVRESRLLATLPGRNFTLLLKHRPLVDREACALIDLQLSGHTHKGQIFPFNLVTKLSVPFNSGTVRVPQGCTVHVSRGSGTWGPPLRLFSPPEVTVLRVVGL